MAFAIVIVKIIGAFYKIPVSNILQTGTADFNNAYNIYSVLLTVSTAGLPVALSKMVAAADALGQEGQIRKIFRVSLTVFFTLGFASFLLMFFGAEFLAKMMNDAKAATAIRYLAPAVVCVSCMSSFRGYAQGRANMTPSAVSQVIEAAGKLVIGLPLAYLAVRAGQSDDIAAAFAILGVTIGSALALVFMMLSYAKDRRPIPRGQTTSSTGAILKELLSIAIPITLTTSAVSIINLIDASVVQGRLQNALMMSETQSREMYAAYSGVMTIYNLPASLVIAVTASVIPFVSAAMARGEKKEAARVTRTAYHVTALMVMPMGVGIAVLGKPIVALLFKWMDPELSGPLLSVLGIASIFVCLVSVSNSILQSYGYQHLPIFVMIGCGLTKVAVNYVLVGLPSVGIKGAPVGTLTCFALAAVVDFVLIRRLVPAAPRFGRLFFGPALATAAMAVAAWGGYKLAHLLLGNTLSICVAIVLAVAVYGFMVIRLQMISRQELKMIPKGEKLADLLKLP